jgi:hypothetical protein
MASKSATGSSPLYDAFVVRLWRDAATGRLLRAEVEHAPTGALARAAGVSTAWVLSQISACLAAGPPTGGALSDDVEATPAPTTPPHPPSRDQA